MASMAFSASSSELFQPRDSRDDPALNADSEEPRYSQSFDELESNVEPADGESSGNAMASAVSKEVLSATDQYSLLGADRDASEMDLRCCFLRRAVEVHPRDRTGNLILSRVEAFCKVAAAWTELRDLGSRWRYDMELQAGRGNLSSSSPTPHKTPPMDVEKALGIFAFETWVCAKNNLPAEDFEPVLREAQELVDNSKEIATLPDSEVTATTVACGMAVSAGLLAAGCVASAAGYPTLGNHVRKGQSTKEQTWSKAQNKRSPRNKSIRRRILGVFSSVECPACLARDRACTKQEKSLQRRKSVWVTQKTFLTVTRMVGSSCLAILYGSCEACRACRGAWVRSSRLCQKELFRFDCDLLQSGTVQSQRRVARSSVLASGTWSWQTTTRLKVLVRVLR